MAAGKKLIFVMGSPEDKKHSKRYNAVEDTAAMSTAYVLKTALAEIGNPAKIKVTIEAA